MTPSTANPIFGQVQYLGPPVPGVINYGRVYRNGVENYLYNFFAACPAFAELFVPIANVGAVMRELNFDFTHNMRGTDGRYVIFYRAVEQWRDSRTKQTKQGVTIKHHA